MKTNLKQAADAALNLAVSVVIGGHRFFPSRMWLPTQALSTLRQQFIKVGNKLFPKAFGCTTAMPRLKGGYLQSK